MSILQAIILGIIHGLTEFLPVSSSGHLDLLQKLLGIKEGNLFLSTMLHLGTIMSVIIVFKKDIMHVIRNPLSKLGVLIIAATIPTVIIAIILRDYVKFSFNSVSSLGFGFLITGLVIMSFGSLKQGYKDIKRITLKDSLFIGLLQGLAVFPAVSRSGMTIAGALYQKIGGRSAACFSFLISIPAVLASFILQIKDFVQADIPLSFFPAILIGTAAAFLSGLIAIKVMLRIVAHNKFKVFSYYLFSLGGLIVIHQIMEHIGFF
jgi:undecaprenyl-diphosphatase